jgi:sugar phosphate isomerase/epimerase
MHRRTFLQTLGVALAAPALACATSGTASSGAAASGAAGTRRLRRIGVQLYTLRDAAQQNLDRILGEIADIGYTDVELLMSNNNFNTPARVVRTYLDKHGLRSPSTHIGVNTLESFDRAVLEARELGHQYFILANLPDEARRSLDSFREWADRLNRAGETARRHNLWIAWHNEPQDFPSFGGVQGYDALVERLDPNLVKLQLDIGNAAMGGRDPMDLMTRYGDRYVSFHVKDVAAMRAERDTELGKGILDIRGILSRVRSFDDVHVYVEQESYPGAPIDSVRRDYQWISTQRV